MNENIFLKKMRILYAEDDRDVSEELVSILKRRCNKVVLAEDGLIGIDLYESLKPDIVIVDLLMPNMNGTVMIEELRKTYPEDIFSVIVLTALSDKDTMLDAVNAGIDKYLIKPIDMELFFSTLEEQAEKLYEHKYSMHIEKGENPRFFESEIRREFAALLKNCTGKGPNNVIVSISSGTVEIIASDFMTVMEKSLIREGGSSGIVKHFRESFFYSMENTFCQMMHSITKKSHRLAKVAVSTEKNRIKLIFTEVAA